MDTATETTQAPETTPEAQTQETTQVETQFDPNTIDPKVKQYFESQEKEKYKDYDTLRQEVGQFRQLTSDQRFQKWYQEMQNPTTPAPKFEITPDEHTAALADPAKMQELIFKAAEFNSRALKTQLEQAHAMIQEQRANADLARVVQKHPEFIELDNKGLIEPVMRRYPGIRFIDAMKIAKSESGWINKQVDEKARAQVQIQKKAITEKGGNSSSTKGKRSFKNRTEAMEYIYKEAQNGREVDSDDIEIS